jgi:hypothetical protein
MWAAEVKKVDVEGLPKWEEKELFKCAGHPEPALWQGKKYAWQCSQTLGCCQDVHGGLQHGHAATQEVLRPGRVRAAPACEGGQEGQDAGAGLHACTPWSPSGTCMCRLHACDP